MGEWPEWIRLELSTSARIEQFAYKGGEKRLRWFGNVESRDSECIGQREEKRKTTEKIHACSEGAHDRMRWKQMVCCDNP